MRYKDFRTITPEIVEAIRQEAYYFHPDSEADRQRFIRVTYGIGAFEPVNWEDEAGEWLMMIVLYVN